MSCVHPCPSSLFFSQCCLPLFLLANTSRHRYTGVSDTFLELGSLLCTSCLLRPFSLTLSLETMRNSAWRSCHACLLGRLLFCCMDIAWFIQSVSSLGNLWLLPDFISFLFLTFSALAFPQFFLHTVARVHPKWVLRVCLLASVRSP